MRFGEIPVAEAEGAILAHSVRFGERAFKKGRTLSAEDIAALTRGAVQLVFAARLDADDVPEDEAAALVARALAGPYVSVQAPFTGRSNLHASANGVVVVDHERVRALNRLHESLTLATLPPFEIVSERQMLATVKVIPFAVPRPVLDRALALIGKEPLVRLAPFAEKRAGLVVTMLPQTKPSIAAKSEEAMRRRLEALGSRLGDVHRTGHAIAEVAAAVEALHASGHDPILVFGASAIVDRGDVIPAAVVAAGGEVLHLGMPVDPGNLLMLGRLEGAPVIGVPSCARSPKVNGFDWVLARVLAGLDVSAGDIMDMGAGGLLMEIPSRPSPRESKAQVLMAPKVAAVVLAAGLSSRMGTSNKLTREIGGRAVIRRSVEVALASQASPVIVVTGHQSAEIGSLLAGLPVTIVHNAEYAAGLSGSIRTGIAAVPGDADAAVVMLGDMPLVEASHVDRLIAAFNPVENRTICVPARNGRRGNPVLWGRAFFAELQALKGDTGARGVIDRNADQIAEVPVPSDAIFADFDTPEAFARLETA